jgi:hypothetical protein
LLNPQELNIKGKAALPAAAPAIFLLTWTSFGSPEVKGIIAETLNYIFQQKVPAREFI